MNSSAYAPQKKARIWFLDLLRIAASFAVIGLHVFPLDSQAYGPDSLHFKTLTCIASLFRWCVPAFLMISGALFLSDQRNDSISTLYRKTIKRVVISFFAWSSFYALVHCLRTGKGMWTFLNQTLRGHYHMWYLFLILGLYLLTPVIKKITESRKTTEYLLLLCFIFVFLLARAFSFLRLFSLPHMDVIVSLHGAVAQANPLPGMYALFYYVLGHYLNTSPQSASVRRGSYILGLAGYLLTAGLTIWHSCRLGAASGHFTDENSLTVLAVSVALFLFFQHAFAGLQPCKKTKAVLTKLSACSYGVYLVHPFLIEWLSPVMPASPLLLPVAMLLWMLAVYGLSFAVSFLLSRIPVLNRYIV